MSFVTANRWSQASHDRQTMADLRIVDASTADTTSYAAGATSAALTVTA